MRTFSGLQDGPAMGHVYFVQAVGGGPIKIGFSTDVDQRAASLCTASPVPIRLIGTIGDKSLMLADERALHVKFEALRIKGEWFAPQEPLIGWLREQGIEPEVSGALSCAGCERMAALRADSDARNKRQTNFAVLYSDLIEEVERIQRCAGKIQETAKYKGIVLPWQWYNFQKLIEKTLTDHPFARIFSPTVNDPSHSTVSSSSEADSDVATNRQMSQSETGQNTPN